ncbi:MAG: fasciclin domain-containing protein, partial [Candidatus Poseidoniaceae archaeon]|nr:fasciclin domain-containing protein [Candidatus Poseidoniaceae archaeon]
TAVNGQPLSFTVGDSVMVNGATVTAADVNTSNGIIHVIDKVLTPTATPNNIPRTAQCTGIHDSLVAAVIQAELLETLQGDGPFTLFAPTDQAFADAGIDLAALNTPEGKAALTDILLYHVHAGSVQASNITDGMMLQMVNGATVTSADVNTSNGIIHVIDAVHTPSDAPNDIPRTAQCTGIHDSLVAAVIQAELLETLQGDGPFTLFAPTDQAFADAGIDLAALNTPEGKATLTDILLYHVHAGSVQASDITEGMMLQMANGDNTTLSLTTGINGANITLADVATSNGLIHVIDAVLMPPAETVDDSSDATSGASDDDDGGWLTILLVVLVVLGGGAGAVLFLRGRGDDEPEPAMAIGQAGMITQLTPVQATSYTPQPTTAYATQAVQQPQVVQPVAQVQAQPVQPIQTVEVIPAVVAEPTVLRQWTDGSGYTWRAMDDGNTYWWTGTEWQKYA